MAKEQQNRMIQCSKDAKSKGLKGDARKKFMKECLRKKGKTVEKKAVSILKNKKKVDYKKKPRKYDVGGILDRLKQKRLSSYKKLGRR